MSTPNKKLRCDPQRSLRKSDLQSGRSRFLAKNVFQVAMEFGMPFFARAYILE
jgi:hypothetical protein